MKLGRIIGTVVSTRKESSLDGLPLYVVRDLSLDLQGNASFVVATDTLGVGTGEVVLYATGSSARQTEQTEGRPVDAVIMAIVDQITVGDETRYDKWVESRDAPA